MEICRLCDHPRKLVKAHIIPEAFFRALRAGGGPPLLVSGHPNRFPARTPIGVYDTTILCEQCESRFARVDTYAATVFLRDFDKLFTPIEQSRKIVAFQSDGVDQKLLLRFLISTLWRASVSTHRFYGKVSLGSYEPIARSAVLSPDAPIPTEFGAVLSRWIADPAHTDTSTGLMDPFRERWDGINAYRFYLGKVVAYIKVSPRPMPSPLNELSLLAQPRLTVLAREFTKSKDLAAMVYTAKLSHRNMLRARQARGRRG